MSTIDAIPIELADGRTIFDARIQHPGRRHRSYEKFRRATKWPHPPGWLATKLGLEPDDPRLEQIALRLALEGKLCLYITRDGRVGDVGHPKEGREGS